MKRIITLALAIVCLASFAIVGVSALDVENNNQFIYFVDLVTPNKIEDVQGYITYDAELMEVVEVETPYIYGAIINYNEPGVIYFNATEVNNGMDFSGDTYKNLIEVKFNITGDYTLDDIETVYQESISYTIEEMTERNGDSYFTNSEQVNEDVQIGCGCMYGVADTEPTTVETEPTTATEGTEATEPTVITTVTETDATGSTGTQGGTTDVPPTGSTVAIFAALAVVAMAGAAVVILRKKVNG
ncbi:MAG: hypothetical protein IJW04_02470 [Ruminococcus sp.]|nr:hypothetical protein [Ruminococcus sp.]